MEVISAKSNDDKHHCSEEAEEDTDEGVESVGEEENCWTTEALENTIARPCSYPEVDMGTFKLHPRLRSLTSSPLNDPLDPVNEHIIAAEKIYRDRIITPPTKPVWFKYIENTTLQRQFMRKKEEFYENVEAEFAEEVLLFHGTTSSTTNDFCASNIKCVSIWDQIDSQISRGGLYFSRYPDRILNFTEDLILCKVLLGPKKISANYERNLNLLDLYDVTFYGSREIEPTDPYLNEIVVSSENQILPYCIISADDPDMLKEIRRINAPKEAKIGQYKPTNPLYCSSSQINNMVTHLSDFQFPELIQVGCRRNGSEIFINRKGEIIVDGKRSSIRVHNHDTCVVQVINEEAEEARKSRRTQCWEENIP